jgi:hypothetical protein
MKKFLFALCVLAFVFVLVALPVVLFGQQAPGAQTPITTNQLTLTLADAPQPVASANVSQVGNPGHRTMYYWVVTEGVIGQSSPAGPYVLGNAADTFTAGVGAQITFSNSNGVTYDVLRTATPAPPAGACNCAVVTGATAGTTVTDVSETLSSYTLTPINPQQYAIILKTTSAGPGLSQLTFGGNVNFPGSFSAGATFSNAVIASTTPPSAVPNIIWDDDVDTDPDAFMTLSMLNHWVDAGQVNILAMVSDSYNPYAAPVMSIVNSYWGHSSIPVGSYQGGSETGSAWTSGVVSQFRAGDTRANYPACVTTLRAALAGAVNSSVTIVGSGFANCLYPLLSSAADGISAMTGAQLVQAKVKGYVQMGGDYPSSSGEFNFANNDPADWSALLTTWTSQNGYPPITFVGYTAGLTTISGIPTWFPATNPARYGLTLSAYTNRPSWDSLAVWYGIFGNVASAWTVSANGTNTVNASTGANTWSSATASGHYYLTAAQSAAFYEAYLDGQSYQGAAWFIPYKQPGVLIFPPFECALAYGCSSAGSSIGPYTMSISTYGILQSTLSVAGEVGYLMSNANATGAASLSVLAGSANGQMIELGGSYAGGGGYGAQLNSLQFINRASGPIVFKENGYADSAIIAALTTNGNTISGEPGAPGFGVWESANTELGIMMSNASTGTAGAASYSLIAGSTNGQLVALDQNYSQSGNYGVLANSLQLINRASGPLVFKIGGQTDGYIQMLLNSSGHLMLGQTSDCGQLLCLNGSLGTPLSVIYGASTTPFSVTNTTAAAYTRVGELFASTITAGQNAELDVGVAESTRNVGSLGFYYAGAGSTSNYIWLGMYGTSPFLEMFGTGVVQIPNVKSTTGTRYVCADTSGNLVSSASACSGT